MPLEEEVGNARKRVKLEVEGFEDLGIQSSSEDFGGEMNEMEVDMDDEVVIEEGIEVKDVEGTLGRNGNGNRKGRYSKMNATSGRRQIVNISNPSKKFIPKTQEDDGEYDFPTLDDSILASAGIQSQPKPTKSSTTKPKGKSKGQNWEQALAELSSIHANDLSSSSEPDPEVELKSDKSENSGVDEPLPLPEVLKKKGVKGKGVKKEFVVPKVWEGGEMDVLEYDDEKKQKEEEEEEDEEDESGLSENELVERRRQKSAKKQKEKGGSRLRFYWFDVREERGGVLMLIGKIFDKSGCEGKGEWRSGCLTVKGLEREVYILPKEGVDLSGLNLLLPWV
jgi:hypothetical protein